MREKRYGIRQDRDGSWTVIDTLTQLPAASDGRDLVKLEKMDAEDIAETLNEDFSRDRKSPLV